MKPGADFGNYFALHMCGSLEETPTKSYSHIKHVFKEVHLQELWRLCGGSSH